MKKIEGYMTRDNKFFDNEEEAIQHERNLDFLNWYKNLPNKKLKVSGNVCLKFILENKDQIKDLIGV